MGESTQWFRSDKYINYKVERKLYKCQGKPGGGMMKLIRLLLKKDGVGKHGSRVVAKNNTYRPNEMRNEQFTLQRRPLKRRSFQT